MGYSGRIILILIIIVIIIVFVIFLRSGLQITGP
jgi:hypothetical protein